MWGAPSDGRIGPSFTIAACLRWSSHSWVRVLWDSWPQFTVSDSRHPSSNLAGHVSVFICLRNRVALLHPLALGSLSKSYFATGGLPPISSPWRQAPWDSRPWILFFQLNPCGHSPYVTLSLTRGWVCLLWICFAFYKCSIAHIEYYWKFFLLHKIQVLCQYRLCKAVMPISLMLQRQLSQLNGRKLGHRQV
jgi:hypothetical protein